MNKYSIRKINEILKLVDFDAKKNSECKFIHKINFFELVSDVYISFCYYNIRSFNPNFYKYYGIEFPDEIKNSVLKRQAEFFAGRYCVRNTFIQSGLAEKNSGYNLPIGWQRSPTWPNGIIGSITHTDNTAISFVAPMSKYKYIGIDLEKIMSRQLAIEIQSSILNDKEIKYLKSVSIPINITVTLAFSAKESLFKALHKYTNDYFGFEIVFITKINLEKQFINLSIQRNFANKHKVPLEYILSYQLNEKNVLTVILE